MFIIINIFIYSFKNEKLFKMKFYYFYSSLNIKKEKIIHLIFIIFCQLVSLYKNSNSNCKILHKTIKILTV